MRTILRVGMTVGGTAFVVLYLLQTVIGLAAAAGIVLAGFAAGLGAAKWLPRTWYGRQFTAGLRTSVIAVCMAGTSVLLAAFNLGTRSEGLLVENLHALGGSSPDPFISHLIDAGWEATTVEVVALAMLLGTALGVLTTVLGAWGKNRHAIQVVNQARLAAQASLYGDTAGLSSPAVSDWTAQSSPGLRASSPGLRPDPIRAELSRAAPSSPSKEPAPVPDQPSWAAPSSFAKKPKLVPAEPSEFQPTEPALPTTRNRISDARPADSQLTEAMREALATWAADNVANSPSETGTTGPEGSSGQARTPQPSAYLNSMPPAPSKRARKKQNTEWIR
jgi:hypothetical protein